MSLFKRDHYASLEQTDEFSLNLVHMAKLVLRNTSFTVTLKETICTRGVTEQQRYIYTNMHCQFDSALSSGNLLHNVAVNVLFGLYSIVVFVGWESC